MKTLKNILITVLFALASNMTASAYDFVSGGIYYNIISSKDKTVEVTEPNSSDEYSGEITIPSSVVNDGISYTVTQIGNSAFYRCLDLKCVNLPNTITSFKLYSFANTGISTLTIPGSVKEIIDNPFYICSNLKELKVDGNNNFMAIDGVLFTKDLSTLICYPQGKDGSEYVIPDGVTTITSTAFYSCSNLKKVIFPESLKTIKSSAFRYARGLKSITLPQSISTIEYDAFECSGLTSVFIPKSVTNLSNSAFAGCQYLTEIVVDEANTNYSSEDGILYDKQKTTLINYPGGKKDKNYTTPESVLKLDDFAFYFGYTNNYLTEVTFTKNIKTISDSRFIFEGCNLKKFTIYSSTPPTILNYDYSFIPNCDLYIPKDSYSSYSTKGPWYNFKSINPIEGGKFEQTDYILAFKFLQPEMVNCVVGEKAKFFLTIKNNGKDFKEIKLRVECTSKQLEFITIKEAVAFGEEKNIEFTIVLPDKVTTDCYVIAMLEEVDGNAYKGATSVSTTINIYSKLYDRNVVIEETTGTWCGWCVRGIVAMEDLKKNYPETAIGIAVHGGDEMAVPNYPAYGSFPGCSVDRHLMYQEVGETFKEYYEAERARRTYADFTMDGMIKDGKLYASSSFCFDFDRTNADFRMVYVVKEDGVTGYTQTNYYSGGVNGPMGGFENKPYSIRDQVFNDVARIIYPSYNGECNLPTTIKAGEHYEYNATIDLPRTIQDINKLTLVGMLIDRWTQEIIQAHQMPLQLFPYIKLDGKREVLQNETIELSLSLDNTVALRGLQFDMTVPEGLEATITKTGSTTDHTLTVEKISANTYRVLSYSGTNSEYPANFGEFAKIKITIPSNYKLGQYNITINDVYLSDANNENVATAGFMHNIKISDNNVVPVLVEKIELNHTNYSLVRDEILQLVATVYPDNATNKDVVWSSSDEGVVSVSKTGKVAFMGFGDAVVTCKALDGSGVFATCTFSNVDGIISISVDGNDVEIFNIDGKKVQKAENGTYIIRGKDGKAKKIVIK